MSRQQEPPFVFWLPWRTKSRVQRPTSPHHQPGRAHEPSPQDERVVPPPPLPPSSTTPLREAPQPPPTHVPPPEAETVVVPPLSPPLPPLPPSSPTPSTETQPPPPAYEPPTEDETMVPPPVVSPSKALQPYEIAKEDSKRSHQETTEVPADLQSSLPPPSPPSNKDIGDHPPPLEASSEEETSTKPSAQAFEETALPSVSTSESRDKKEAPKAEIQEREEEKPSKPYPRIPENRTISCERKQEEDEREENEEAIEKQMGKNTSCSRPKEREISIASAPRLSFAYGDRSSFQAQIEEGASKLVQKLNLQQPGNIPSSQATIITFAGENRGATMRISYELHHSRNEENEKSEISACVNSNVQSINNSLLQESHCRDTNPGVHLTACGSPNKTIKEEDRVVDDDDDVFKRRSQLRDVGSVSNVRRRCLRGLFAEPSDGEGGETGGGQRHGCRFSIEKKKEKLPENSGGNAAAAMNKK